MSTTSLAIELFSPLNRFTLGLVLAAILWAPATALADNFQPWTSVASAGAVDESDTGIVAYGGATVRVASGAALPARLDIRYNVVAVDGLLQGLDGTFFDARFRDNGPDARVILRLKGINMSTGSVSTVFQIDSDTFPVAVGFQVGSDAGCGVQLNFNDNAYFVEAQLIKSAAGGNPGLQIVRSGNILC